MKCSTQMALGVGAGYLLGRRRKMRLAMGLGVAAATGGLGGVTRKVLKGGTGLPGTKDLLGKVSPELSDITETVRGELVEVGKAAALAAVRGQLNRVSDRLHEQAEGMRQGRQDREEEPDDGGEPEDRGDADEAEDYDDADDADEDAGEADEDDESETVPPRPRSRRPAAAGRSGSRTRSSAGGSPVRRTRR